MKIWDSFKRQSKAFKIILILYFLTMITEALTYSGSNDLIIICIRMNTALVILLVLIVSLYKGDKNE